MNRSFTARLSGGTPQRLRDYLWATHRLFNESLAYLLKHYFWMQNLTDREADGDTKNRLRQRFDAEALVSMRVVYEDLFGKHLPKKKRQGRSQNAHAWMEQITFSPGSKGGDKNKGMKDEAKLAIKQLLSDHQWLFDRELAFPLALDNGFRRSVMQSAARRILNFEQNEETHKNYYDDAGKAFERWTGGQLREDGDDATADTRRAGWRRTVLLRDWGKNRTAEREAEIDQISRLNWTDFERAREEFAAYERERAEVRAREQKRPLGEDPTEPINAGMTRGWRDIYERLVPSDAAGPPDKSATARIIKDYQAAEPRRIGDVNFFLWLADKPHLWRFVETMRRYNDFRQKLKQYQAPIQFRYPRYDRRPEWFSFSETSPGHMYTIISMQPLVVDLSVFVPIEDAPILKKLAKGKPLTDEERMRLDQPIDWSVHRLTPARLAERRAAYREQLEKSKPGLIAQAGLDAVQEWTDGVWHELIEGFFRGDPPLDLSGFERVMVRYTMATDARLAAFVEQPASGEDLTGRLVVETDARQEKRWQGRYKFWFGPLTAAKADGGLIERRRWLRPMPLVVGGARLEYRGRLGGNAGPIFTLSCDLDEKTKAEDGRLVDPVPGHRIPKRESEDGDAGATPQEGKAKRRTPGKRRKLPVGLRVLVIDLGMRHIATGAVVEFVDDGKGNGVLPNPLKPAAVEFIDVPGVTLAHIQRHQDERRRKQRRACPRGSRKAFEIRGAHLPRGQEFARELLGHAENLKDDRRKKAAHAVLGAALEHSVDYIVFENLKGYRPDMEFGRRVNASLMTWNRRELVEFVRMEAKPFGIWVYDYVPPHHTSRFCHRCGGVGHRFNHVTPRDAAKDALAPAAPATDTDGKPVLDDKGKPVFSRKWTPRARRMRGTPLGLAGGMRQAMDGGKQFCCTECGLLVNADYNAAMNLARKLADDFPVYQRYGYDASKKAWVVDGKAVTTRAFWDRARALAQRTLNRRFGQPEETPPAGGWPDGFPVGSPAATPW